MEWGLSNTLLYPGSQPMALDVNGDQSLDLLYQTATDGIKVALGSLELSTAFVEEDFFSNFVLTADQNPDCKTPNTSDLISIPNSNAFIDLNGDCLQEIVLTRQGSTNTYYEIYSQVLVGGQARYCLAAQNGQLVAPNDVRSGTTTAAPMPLIELADFNRDGMTDLAFASETGVLTILYNQFTAPGPKSTNLCNDVENTSDLKYKRIFPEFPFSANQNGVTQIKLNTTDAVTYKGIADSMPSATSLPSVPGRLRVADVDMDGYIDILMTLRFQNETSNFTRSTILLN